MKDLYHIKENVNTSDAIIRDEIVPLQHEWTCSTQQYSMCTVINPQNSNDLTENIKNIDITAIILMPINYFSPAGN
jgi:hypothetical protein